MPTTVTIYARRELSIDTLADLKAITGTVPNGSAIDDQGRMVLTFDAELTTDQINQVTALMSSASDDEQALQTFLRNSLAADRVYVQATSTTTAQDKAQLKALTRQVIALIRFATRQLDGTD